MRRASIASDTERPLTGEFGFVWNRVARTDSA
jgi:hypothetical protein